MSREPCSQCGASVNTAWDDDCVVNDEVWCAECREEYDPRHEHDDQALDDPRRDQADELNRRYQR